MKKMQKLEVMDVLEPLVIGFTVAVLLFLVYLLTIENLLLSALGILVGCWFIGKGVLMLSKLLK